MAVSRTVVSDDQLAELAAEPVQPLLPILRRADLMYPFVLVLGVLPLLMSIQSRGLHDTTAVWCVEAQRCAAATSISQFFDAGPANGDSPARWLPKLATSLAGLGEIVFGIRADQGAVALAFFSTVALVGSLAALGWWIGGPRIAVFVALFASFQPELLDRMREASPIPLGLLFTVVGLFCYLRHVEESLGPITGWLLSCGVALGLALLAIGSVAIWMLVAVALFGLLNTLLDRNFVKSTNTVSGRLRAFVPSILSCGALVGTVFAVGGWWELMMGSWYGGEFWSAWWTWSVTNGNPTEQFTRRAGGLVSSAWDWSLAIRPLGVFALLGVNRAISSALRESKELSQMGSQLILGWFVTATATWLGGGTMSHASPWSEDLWLTVLLLPSIVLAAIGLFEIVDRRISFETAIGCFLVTLLDATCLPGRPGEAFMSPTRIQVWLIAMSATLICGVTGWILWSARNETRRRHGLVTCLIAVGAILVLRGVASIATPDSEGRDFDSLRAAVRRQRPISSVWVVCADRKSPEAKSALLHVRYMAQSVCPVEKVEVVTSAESIRLRDTPERSDIRPTVGLAEIRAPSGAELTSNSGPTDASLIVACGDSLRLGVLGATANPRPVGPICHLRGVSVGAYVVGRR